MTIAQTDNPTLKKPLRLWPGVLAVVLQWLVWFVLPMAVPGAMFYRMIAGVFGGGLAVVVWWLFFSRARWSERVGALVVMTVALFATSRVVHESIANGMMGMMLPISAIPLLSLALVASVAAGRRLSNGPRRASMVAAILLACGVFTLVRTGGITGDGDSDLHWRWTETPEERLLAQAANEPAAPSFAAAAAETSEKPLGAAASEPAAPTPAPSAAETSEKRVPTPAREPTARTADPAGAKTAADWPGFRGPARDGIVRGVRIETDWTRKPPVAL